MKPMGKTRWAIADGFIPSWSASQSKRLESHESASLLNVSDPDAHVQITIFFSDRGPAGPYLFKVPAQRTLHIRFNELKDPEELPRGTDYSCLIESDVPI